MLKFDQSMDPKLLTMILTGQIFWPKQIVDLIGLEILHVAAALEARPF